MLGMVFLCLAALAGLATDLAESTPPCKSVVF